MNKRGKENLRAHIIVTQYRRNCLLALREASIDVNNVADGDDEIL